MLHSNQEDMAQKLLDVVLIRIRNQMDTSAQLQSSILDSILKDSIHIFRNEAGEPIGYITWANVKRETLGFISKTQTLPGYPYEWHEGKIKLFFDLVLSNEWRYLARYRLFLFLRKHRLFAYYRKNKLKICKHKYPRANGYFWHYQRIKPMSMVFFKPRKAA